MWVQSFKNKSKTTFWGTLDDQSDVIKHQCPETFINILTHYMKKCFVALKI